MELHQKFLSMCPNVYFQAPTNIKMHYPAIRYKRNRVDVTYSDDGIYLSKIGYQVTYIDSNPDSEIPTKIQELPFSRFETNYTSDNLNHDVYNIFY